MKFGPRISESSFTDRKIFDIIESQSKKNSVYMNFPDCVDPFHITIDSHKLTALLKKFIRKLKNRITKQILPKFNFPSLIFDEASIFDEKQNSFLLQLFEEIIEKLIIPPYNLFLLVWNYVVLINVCFSLFYFPFEIAFQTKNDFNFYIDIIILFSFSFEIFINFITGDFIEGSLVMNPRVIFKNYLKGQFICDILAIASLAFKINQPAENYEPKIVFGFFIFMKIPSFFKCAKIVLNQCKMGEKFQNFVEIIKLIFSSIFIAHILACLFYLCSKTNSDQNWVKYFGIQNETSAKKYLFSVYWAITTMSTAGYNIITPQNDYEVLFTIFSVIVGCCIYAYILNSIGLILKQTQKGEIEFQKELRIINNFMNRKGTGLNLQRKVQEFLNFAWLEQKSIKNEDEKKVINKLEESIREELLFEFYSQFLNSPVFMNNFSEQSLRKIAKIVREIKYVQDEEIFQVY